MLKFDNCHDACFPLLAFLTGKKDCLLPPSLLVRLGLSPGARAPLTAEILEAARKEFLSYAVDTGKSEAEESWGTITDALGRVEEVTPKDGLQGCIESLSVLAQTTAFAEGRKLFPWKKIIAALSKLDFAAK